MPGHGGADHRRALGGRGVVRLQHEAGQPELLAPPGQLRSVIRRGDEVRRDVDVQVEAAADQLARALRRSGPRRRSSAGLEADRARSSTAMSHRPPRSATRARRRARASSSTAAAISSTRRAACVRAALTSRRQQAASVRERALRRSPSNSQSSQPQRARPPSASTIAAASPFMKTLRSSLRRAASPGSPPTHLDRHPQRPRSTLGELLRRRAPKRAPECAHPGPARAPSARRRKHAPARSIDAGDVALQRAARTSSGRRTPAPPPASRRPSAPRRAPRWRH